MSNVNEEVNGIILELNQTTERNILLIEEKINKISQLIEDSDKSIQILDRRIKIDNRVDPTHYSHLEKKRKFPVIEDEIVKKTEEIDENQNDKKRIMELYNNGLSSDLIASKTGTTIGEVELIITLNSRKG